ncbi:DNA polymerase III subunit gamma/tau [Prevotella melaninogenica]|uniref:DNA polymerase III subunit gamma/tau n=1 Tax=Prevotella melaninogenica TaxID=28132 RepID=UPI001BAC0AF1|nr:DNA polymerase III subunit gamma/tau [Prevotella melaninogenica]QUB55645.1 DNA polymerase III subunit gamma/tau [Prevotella melaninogenica]QUB58247.1 DNA polymerase III subunit gamma/tau [Prevotella melaninogenica]
MDEYIVSARKYRPMSFDSVVGQQALTTTLKNAVKSGKLAHAYLFCGPRGVGKTTCARIFAKAINCEHPTADSEACNECESCKAFNEGRSYNIFELDAASNNSVENIKSLMDQTRIPPQVGRYKVFIIDEVHMLSTAAFNAFLKTLEEPPAHVIFILATTDKHKILPTILSRCQIYDFERMTVPNIIDHLKRVAEKENIQYDEEALNVIAEKADGGMRDALSIFDQVASYSQGNITYQKVIEDLNVLDAENYFNIIDLALENKVSEIMVLLNSVINKGFDGGHLVNGLASHVRNVLMAKDAQTLPLLEVSEQLRNRYQLQAQKCPVNFLYTALQIMNRCDVEYRQSSNKRLLVELTLIQVAQITQKDDDVPASGRSPKRLKSLFKNLVLKAQQKPTPQVVGSLKRDDDTVRSSNVAETVSVEVVSSPEKPVVETSGARPKMNVPSGIPNSVNLGSLTMSFDNLLKTDKKKNQDEEVEITNKDEHEGFTQQDLVVSWRAMCSRMPERMQALSQRMKNITPTISEYPAILVLAGNNIQLNEMLAIKSRIRATLAKELRNGQIEVEIRLAKHEEIKPMLTPRESLSKLLETNHPVKKLIDTLGLCLD